MPKEYFEHCVTRPKAGTENAAAAIHALRRGKELMRSFESDGRLPPIHAMCSPVHANTVLYNKMKKHTLGLAVFNKQNRSAQLSPELFRSEVSTINAHNEDSSKALSDLSSSLSSIIQPAMKGRRYPQPSAESYLHCKHIIERPRQPRCADARTPPSFRPAPPP